MQETLSLSIKNKNKMYRISFGGFAKTTTKYVFSLYESKENYTEGITVSAYFPSLEIREQSVHFTLYSVCYGFSYNH